ncbi:MAG TPA: hypothetical protein DCZ92_01115 [Elusimicrobia bacterium]|nr:MAG: hypothetical protein A2016_04810 [Elusimicrobia bacterium GWF2_62_30]HBA59427.1 hypothetical protein [Elusimicrobiota bacterium]
MKLNKALVLFFLLVSPSSAFPAQDYTAEIKKMFANKDDVDISVSELDFKVEICYFLSDGTLYENVYGASYEAAVRDIDFANSKTGKNTLKLYGTGGAVFDLNLKFQAGKSWYHVLKNGALEPQIGEMTLHFPYREMAEQALVYLKRVAESSETPVAAAAPAVLSPAKTGAVSAAYKEVKIGKQTWMAANLEVAVFANGEAIPEANTKAAWDKATKEKTPAWCYYDNDPANGKKYGKLYNWYAVHDPRGLAPKGWHVPSKEEFERLTGMAFTNGKELKSDNDWQLAGNGDNSRGFDGRPGGYCSDGVSRYRHSRGNWWSSSTDDIASYAQYLVLEHNIDLAMVLGLGAKHLGMSVRCIKDQEAAQATDIPSGAGAAAAVPVSPGAGKVTPVAAAVLPSPKKSAVGSTSKEVVIGRQTWMAKNLDVAVFANGEAIPEANTAAAWKKASEEQTPAWCYYDYDPANGEKYGKLYNWYAVSDKRGLAPKGWHIPAESEFDLLTGKGVSNGKKLKSNSGWTEYEELEDDWAQEPTGNVYGNGDNSSGFDGRPGGYCRESGLFEHLQKSGNWWSSSTKLTTYALYLVLENSHDMASVYFHDQGYGASVRCVKD